MQEVVFMMHFPISHCWYTFKNVNSSPSSAVCMRQWIGSALIQIMAGRNQAIIWTNVELLLIGPLGSEIQIGTNAFSFKKMHLKMSSAKWRPGKMS